MESAEPLSATGKPASARLGHIALIALAAVLAYSNTFHAPLIADDAGYITGDPAINSWGGFIDAATGRLKLTGNLAMHFQDRIVAFATFTLNHALGGVAPAGYHVLNLAVHIAAALTLYWLGLMLIKDRGAALLSALLFAVHPIQTEAVTYISQRFASMAALFYLLALALYVRSRLEPGRGRSLRLYALSLVCVLLAARSKETAFTLPAAMVLIDACFLGGIRSVRPSRLLPWIAVVMVIPATLLINRGMAGAASATSEIGRAAYFLTSERVLLTYMRLIALPVSQNFGYDYPLYTSLLQWPVLVAVLVNLSLLSLAVWFYRRPSVTARWAAFGIVWFYLTLSVESSIVPLGDLIFEHRLYLPLAGVALSISAIAMHSTHRKAVTVVAAAAVLVLMAATYARNSLYSDPVAFWEDAASKSPQKLIVLDELGRARLAAGDYAGAAGALGRAVSLFPPGLSPESDVNLNPANRVHVLNSLGIAYIREGETDKAAEAFEAAVSLFPPGIEIPGAPYHDDAVIPLFNLWLMYSRAGDPARAGEMLRRAEAVDPEGLARLMGKR